MALGIILKSQDLLVIYMKKMLSAGIIAIFAILVLGFAVPSFAAQPQGQSPQTPCAQQSSNQQTSSDGSMFVQASALYNTCTHSDGGNSVWEVSSGGTTRYLVQTYACNSPVWSGYANDTMSGCLSASGTTTYGTANYASGTQYQHSYPANVGPVTVQTNGWSGNGAPSSSNEATVLASAPP